MCPTKWHKLRQARDFFERNKIVETYLLSERLALPSGKFSATAPSFFCSDYVGLIKPYKTVKTEV